MHELSTPSALCIAVLLAACNWTETERSQQSEPSRATFFTDVTDEVGLRFLHHPGVDGSYFLPEVFGSGAAFLDYDNDGNLDIYLLNGSRHSNHAPGKAAPKNRLFRQNPKGTFEDVTDSSGLGDTGYGTGVAVGDIDNDGDADVYVTNYGPDTLYLNNGNGTFTEISKAAGIRNPEWGSSVLFFDYNLDGFLDIYVSNYVAFDPSRHCTDAAGRQDYCGPGGFSGVPDLLYRNNGDGTFTDVSVASGIAEAASKGLGVVSADFNDDLYPDLYVANDGEPNHLWTNQHNGTFQEEALIFGAALNELGRAEAGMGIALGDADNDADFDLFVTHLREESNTFYRNTGEYGFQDDTTSTALAGVSLPYTGFGTGFVDYDHDGDLDLAVVNGRVIRGPVLTNHDPPGYWDPYAEPNLLFENKSGRFADVSDQAGALCQQIENSRGLAFGDVDHDGDIDLLVTNDGGPARLLRNDVPEKGHWLLIRAIDPALRRDAIGAKIVVTVGSKQLLRTISPAYSYLCSNDPHAHFGLGRATVVDQIQVRWPDGEMDTYTGIEADRILTLKKGQSHVIDG